MNSRLEKFAELLRKNKTRFEVELPRYAVKNAISGLDFWLEKTSPFFIHADLVSAPGGQDYVFGREEIERVSLPFQCCFFEFFDASGFLKIKAYEGVNISFCSFLVAETSPTDWLLWAEAENDSNGESAMLFAEINLPKTINTLTMKGGLELVGDLNFDLGTHAIGRFFAVLLALQQTHLAGRTLKGETIRFRDNKRELRKVKISPAVHVFPKTTDYPKVNLGADIEWSHRWTVRGHWRKVAGIGKDREGKYTQSAFTWVLPHEKGRDDQKAIQKTRIFHQQEAAV